MRILGITETCDLGSMYLRLIAEGHEVKVSISEALAQGTMAGLVPRAERWEDERGWVHEDSAGIVLFEAVGFGELQDQMRLEGFNVIGGSAFGDRLENDREYGLRLLHDYGLNLAPLRKFTSATDAIADLQQNPRRCVFKRCDSAGHTFVGTLADGADVAALLRVQPPEIGVAFILMDYVDGIETGVGAYFNGQRFLRPACVDWEHKSFFAGGLGEQTGEMGTVATFTGAERLFDATLRPLEPLFREAGHVGWINLNTIINEQGVWPLEFTCRFGYPGFAVLQPLQKVEWSALFRMLIDPTAEQFPVHCGYSAGIVLTTPPMPLSRKEVGAPIGLPLVIGKVDSAHLHLGEVGLSGTDLVTAGLYGWTAVVTGTGETIKDATVAAYANAAQIYAPNLRYRLDIGDALINGELAMLSNWGWLRPNPA